MAEFGDARWEAARGRTSAAERFRYALAVVGARFRIVARGLGAGRPAEALHRVSLERIVHPDSACAKAALEKVSSLASPAMANHALRTYVWGSLLGQLDGRRSDEEILYVSSLLHDLGLTDALHGSCREARCFTLEGVDGAADVFARTTPERAERMRRGVLVHLNVDVPGDVHGWEAQYVQAGASLDVLGQRYHELPSDVIRAVLTAHPRLNAKDELAHWIAREHRLRPDSRMGMLDRMGFTDLVRRAPFDS